MKAKFLVLLALVLGVVSCQTEPEGLDVNVGGEIDAIVNVTIPEVETRAGGNDSALGVFDNGVLAGDATMRYILQVYYNGERSLERLVKYSDEKSVAFDVRLVPGRDYQFVVWADVVDGKDKGDKHYNTADLKNITLNDRWVAMDESRDAFTATVAVNDYSSASNITVKLQRPFAKLRVVTTDMVALNNLDIKPTKATVTYSEKHYNAFNAFVGEAIADTKNRDIKHETFDIAVYGDNSNTDKVLFTDYFFAENDLVKFNLDVFDQNNVQIGETVAFNTDIPVNANYLTTIKGNILTDGKNFNVTIDDAFANGTEWNPENDKHDVEIWDGKSLKVPAYNEDTKTYSIKLGSELAWLAAAVNGTLETRAAAADSFNGKTFILTQDIDLGYNEWTPIGNSTNKFQGTFDGQDHKVANLLISGRNNYVGLFGFTTDGEIKNLVVENAKVSGRVGVGVVAGSPYTSKFKDITVQGHVEVNGMSYVGGVGGRNAYAAWENITVDVDETSYVDANSVENGTAYRTYVGGVIGFIGEDPKLFKNITSNIDVKGSTIDVGGLFGIAHYGNQFENCSCSGDVEIYAAEEADAAQEIGGIAGVWNNGGADVVFTNCTFTGTLKTNISDVDFYYGGLVGKPYSATGTGKLIIDGYEMVANGVGVKDGEYFVMSAQGLAWVEAQEDKYFAGKTIKLANDIDMTGVTIEKPIHFWNGRTTFDGQNHTISNLTMSTTSTEKKPFGLFGGTADIKNVTFDNANISGYSYVAVVAGNLYGNIDNCHVANSTVTCTYWMAGAMSGQYNNGNVTNCSVKNTTVTGPAAVGALVGNINETAGERKIENCTVENCTVAQNGSFGGDYDLMFGSVVGLININNSNVYINGCEVENTTVKGATAANVFGCVGGDQTKVYINGYEFVADGVGMKDGEYYISSAAGLKWVADKVNSTTPYTASIFDNTTVKLTNNIDLNNEEWIPIGDDRSQRTEWHGVFDGQGFTVSNIKITKKTDIDDDNKSSYGLFGNVKGTVKNLTVENVSISGAPKFIGALVGRLNDGLIENCHVKNSAVECENWTIGGLVGQFNNGKISNCSVEGTSIKGYAAVGAIAGIALSNGERTIENCTVKNCSLIQNGNFGGDYDKMFGAIVGALYSGNLIVNVNNCSVEDTNIKNKASSVICGFVSEGDKLLINGYEFVADGLLKKDNEYKVTSAAGLVTLSGMTIKGNEVVTLGANIDLNGVPFNGLNAFNPENNNTFDGKGYTVSNWTNNSGASDMGFIKNWVGPIKNVKFDNCHLKTSGRSAIVAAKVYGNIENVEVKNSSIVDSYWACGIIAGLYNAGSISSCAVTNSSVKSNGGTAAIVGVINESASERNLTNCSVTGCTINNTGAYGADYSGGALVGMFNVDNATHLIEGCTVSNNTLEGSYVFEKYPANENVTEE